MCFVGKQAIYNFFFMASTVETAGKRQRAKSKSVPEGVILRLVIPSRFQFQVALVMTDGKQTVNEGVLSSDVLYNAVQPLKDKNVKVLSLGIGKNTNLFDLWTLASSDNDVFLAENFEQLKDLVTDLTQNKCPGKKTC